MQTKRAVPVMLLMLYCSISALLSACGALSGTAAAPADPGITPVDTSPGYLDAKVMIIEDQEALTNRSSIAISFSTIVIEDTNYWVNFDDPNEVLMCINAPPPNPLRLGNLQSYTLSVPRGAYTCSYTGNRVVNPANEANAQAQMTTFTVPLQSMLSPLLPTVTSSGFTLHYTPNASPLYKNCTIAATAIDRVSGSTPVLGGSFPETGTYTSNQSVSGLHGPGDIELTRTCNPQITASPFPFHNLSVTYVTKASVEVTWTT